MSEQNNPDDTEEEPDEEQITCWCGATGTASELFDDEVYSQSCGGSGYLDCECGGDICVCHHHGEIECAGCEDCEFMFDSDDDEY